MGLTEFAKRELEIAGYYEGDEMNLAMAEDVLELIQTLADQYHSGFSASHCIAVFGRLASYKPLKPLTGEDSEWNDVCDGLWQNNRCSTIFKDKDGAYNIEGKVFIDPKGCYYTNGESKVRVEFPYTPTEPEYIKVSE